MSIHTQIIADAAAFIMTGKTLAAALAPIKTTIEARCTIPILSMVRIASDADGMTITGTNLDRFVTQRIPLEGLPAFDVCVDYKTLCGLAKAKAKQTILIETANGFTIDGIDLPTRSPDDFPSHLSHKEGVDLAINGATFLPLLKSISTEETRYYLNGALIHAIRTDTHPDGECVIVSTDGHRLARSRSGISWTASTDWERYGVIIPRDFVQILAKQPDGVLTIREDQVSFRSGNFSAVSKIIDGRFPDYQRVIPLQNDIQAMVVKADLMNALNTLKPFVERKAAGVRLTFENQTLTIERQCDGYLHRAIVANAAHDAESFSIGFNLHYLVDLCDSQQSETVTFEFSDAASPTRFTDGARDFVLMPMRA